jgi:hypothetical protein
VDVVLIESAPVLGADAAIAPLTPHARSLSAGALAARDPTMPVAAVGLGQRRRSPPLRLLNEPDA